MADRLVHRGPDDRGHWSSNDAPLAFAHTRLAIRDLSASGAQPMIADDGRSALSFNGELFGIEPLRRELQALGQRFRGASDTEVLLHALSRWGVRGALRRVHGQFAFAWFDGSERRLYLVRDPLGIRPLYVAHAGDRLVAASEQKALLPCEWVDRSPDPDALVRFLALHRTDDIPFTTMLRGIVSLPAGHLATWDGTRLEFERFYRLDVAPPPSTVHDVRVELERAVEEQLVSDVPLGAFVSGGIDSSAVVALADLVRRRRGVSDPLHLFAYHDEVAEADERMFQRAVIDGVRSEKRVHWISSRPDAFAREFERYVEHQEEPYGDVSSFAEYCIARSAREHGVKVLLSGLGGDEVFLGYPSFLGPFVADLIRQREWTSLRGTLDVVARVARGGRYPRASTLVGAVYHSLPGRMRNLLTLVRSGREAGLGAATLYSSALRFGRAAHPHDGSPATNAALRGAIESWTVPRFLLHSDRMTLAFGVEGRVPLLDEGVLRAAFGVPLHERVGASGLKAALRAATADVLPTIVRDRAWKLGFHVPLAAYTSALDAPLRAGHARVCQALGGGPRWEELGSAMQWRWGIAGAYLGWVDAQPRNVARRATEPAPARVAASAE